MMEKAYYLLTQMIVILGAIREALLPKIKPHWRTDRLCYAHYSDTKPDKMFLRACDIIKSSQISCCDCGAVHEFWDANDGIYGIPIRPKDYTYGLRWGSKPATLANKEQIKRMSNDKRGANQ